MAITARTVHRGIYYIAFWNGRRWLCDINYGSHVDYRIFFQIMEVRYADSRCEESKVFIRYFEIGFRNTLAYLSINGGCFVDLCHQKTNEY